MKQSLPLGFRGAGVSAGIKSSGAKDLTLIVNDGPQLFATAVFTSNQVVAAPVTWTRQVIKDQTMAAVLLNSGGANACTGPDGFADTHKSAEKVAEVLGISSGDVGICSTGLIGVRLPMDALLQGIENACQNLSPESLLDVASGIMTTDSKPKIETFEINGTKFVGIAKGAGMLAPALATMLSVIMTDAIVETHSAIEIFKDAIERTFNRIDSDGCTSTNDTVIFMSSGASGVTLSGDKFWHALSIPCKSASIGSRTPIRPVEQIPTSPDEIPRTSATFSADLWVSANPSGPVHAFAPPLLRSPAAIV